MMSFLPLPDVTHTHALVTVHPPVLISEVHSFLCPLMDIMAQFIPVLISPFCIIALPFQLI